MKHGKDSISNLSDVEIVRSANGKDLYVEKFGFKYAELRKKAKKLNRKKLLTLVNEVENGFFYRSTDKGDAFVTDSDLRLEFKKLNFKAIVRDAVEEAFSDAY